MTLKADEYALIAPFYDLLLNPILDPLRRKVTKSVLSNAPGRVLDVCCGTGRQSIFLHQHGVQVFGVDNSMAMLKQAYRKSPVGLPYLLADATKISFAEASFDALVLCFALHEKSPAVRIEILREAGRVLKPGGILVIVDYIQAKTSLSRAMQPLVRLVERVAGVEHALNHKQFMLEGGLDTIFSGTNDWVRQQFLPVFFGVIAIAVYSLRV
jgi:demethylmenaquinone methyltransferase/2-methoxy-6-polyprenyl-1,4-benzoquinol methylase